MYKLINNLMRIDESSIDYPQKDLDFAVWDKKNDSYTLREDVRIKILSVLKEYPDVSLLAIAKEIRIVGSIASNQYVDDADVDIHIVPKNIGNWTEEGIDKVIKWFNSSRDRINGWIINHPIEVYIQLDPNQDLMSDGCYSLLDDEWLTGPKIVPLDYDPYEDFSGIADDLRDVVEDADKLFGELKRDVIDHEVIKQAMEQLPPEQKELFLERLGRKLEEIEDDIEILYKKRKEWTSARREASKPETPEEALEDIELAKKWKDQNAIFKFVNRYKYLRIIGDLKELLADEEITPDEIDQIKNIVGVH